MLKKIALILLTLIALFCLVAAFQPKDYVVTRSTIINGPASVPFAYVNDLHKWQSQVSPYTKIDPAAAFTFSGPNEGVGASLHWAGNSQVGVGTMTVTESRPGEFVRFRIDFEKPFKSTCYGEYVFRPASGSTEVSWTMRGEKVFVTKAMDLVINLDRMIGKDFETGLANLKRVSESQPKA